MVAEAGPDVRVWLLTCDYAEILATTSKAYTVQIRPGGTGRWRVLAAICAQYVPRF